jgi:hypothetical protein
MQKSIGRQLSVYGSQFTVGSGQLSVLFSGLLIHHTCIIPNPSSCATTGRGFTERREQVPGLNLQILILHPSSLIPITGKVYAFRHPHVRQSRHQRIGKILNRPTLHQLREQTALLPRYWITERLG